MNRRVLRPTVGLLLLAVGWGCTRDPTAPFIALCTSQPSSAVAAFEDANLEAEIRAGLFVGSQEDLTCGLLETLTNLNAGHSGIASLAGIENLTSLTTLAIRGNSITDIGPLGGLTSLTFLNLAANSITDISALSGLTSLTFLDLSNNTNLTDIQPLLDNTGLGAGDVVNLGDTNVSCTDVAALEAEGVTVVSDCP